MKKILSAVKNKVSAVILYLVAMAESACTFIGTDQVVISYLKHRPIIDYQAEARRIAAYYGAGIITEEGEIVTTEDAEVLSIETVPNA